MYIRAYYNSVHLLPFKASKCYFICVFCLQGDLGELGKLLMQGSFNVWTDHKKGHNKVKDLARFKPMQRHLFLYAKTLLFCKKREESTEGHEKSPSYSFKNALKVIFPSRASLYM